ncbi:tRNA nucleotidyltransferase (CCA-adding enzyme) [Eubacterium maltosivorans]|uniref:CCA tRNA nucleotidyltransferase n=1 Tax=Eubacterium maltosivorans TaxID=2041044 RepID=A0A4P9C992_EUBML|nr:MULTISPECIES: hypothetical protein [Eubacterium]MBS6341846.1 hypothetical protein [Eubacterium limosum]MDO5432478.1 hypothetical protein [Eubacterium sp.]QCT72013.1 hypothetical protein CPZ25_011975 [Eubacterium maltosivorans]WPK82243.1 CCA-adding enzyme [Eubacterium maltosivorans]SDP55897.1 tRNA nucleotidyltransferase (CCA-adding enzyme) [Eubacterium maltosivorans]
MKKAIETLFQVFREHHKQLYIVGGAVRDMLLGQTPSDYDFTTDALPDEVESWFEHTIIVGKRFGTIGVIIDRKVYEITTFRREAGYGDGRHPDEVLFTGDVREDVRRRDFTINGLLMDEHGCIFDYVGGLKDLRKGMVRCIGNPGRRFEEDRLRKWRCIRLAAEKRMELDEETRSAIRDDPDTTGVSIERIREELTRIMLCEKVAWGGYLLIKTELLGDLLNRMVPDYWKRCEDYLIDGFEIMGYLPKKVPLRLASLLLNMFPEERKVFLREMRYSNKEKQLAYAYCHHVVADSQDIVGFKEALADIGMENAEDFLAFQDGLAYWDGDPSIKRAAEQNQRVYRRIIANREPMTLRELAVGGKDLTDRGYQGEAIKESLTRLLKRVYEYPEENKKDRLLSWLERETHGKTDLPKGN